MQWLSEQLYTDVGAAMAYDANLDAVGTMLLDGMVSPIEWANFALCNGFRESRQQNSSNKTVQAN